MRVGVGFSEDSDTEVAGIVAAQQALEQAQRSDACDVALLFSASSHEPMYLRSVVASVVGDSVPIVGGGAIGAITNHNYGYAGDQVGVAAIWLDDVECYLHSEGNLYGNEKKVGQRLGERLAARNVGKNTPSILFYDAINRNVPDVPKLNLATPLLQGIADTLGFLPDNLVGAGLQSDFECSPYLQFYGRETDNQRAIMLSFSEKLRIDSVIMHGCRPTGEYYTVTKADNQTILEINGQPALSFIESQLHPALPAETFPFFMIFGVNRDPDGPFNENNYANRLCFDIDKKRNGIVMFESDMVAGTRFQIMYRSLDLEYIPPKIETLFKKIHGKRQPVFALYIDCAGRAARFKTELEDAVVVQKSVADRVPLLGIYTGVEIAPIMGQPRTLDWTGVFCLFSVEK